MIGESGIHCTRLDVLTARAGIICQSSTENVHVRGATQKKVTPLAIHKIDIKDRI